MKTIKWVKWAVNGRKLGFVLRKLSETQDDTLCSQTVIAPDGTIWGSPFSRLFVITYRQAVNIQVGKNTREKNI